MRGVWWGEGFSKKTAFNNGEKSHVSKVYSTFQAL